LRRIPLLAIVAALALGADAAPDLATARGVVDDLHAALTGMLKEAEALGYAGRYERLEPVLPDTLDLPFMARKSVGRHWRNLEEAQRRQLLDTFTRLTISTYAARFDGDEGSPRFETLGVEDGGRDTALVRTRLERTEEEPIQLDYRLRPTDDGWRVIDIYLNGTISELALRRSEYSSVIERDGFDGLLRALEDTITRYAAGEDPESIEEAS